MRDIPVRRPAPSAKRGTARIMSRIGANALEHFRRAALRSAPGSPRCQRDMSLRISLTLHFRSPDARVPPQWP